MDTPPHAPPIPNAFILILAGGYGAATGPANARVARNQDLARAGNSPVVLAVWCGPYVLMAYRKEMRHFMT